MSGFQIEMKDRSGSRVDDLCDVFLISCHDVAISHWLMYLHSYVEAKRKS